MFEPLCPPDEPLRPCEDDCEPPGLGMEEPERPPPPEDEDGMLELLPPPPEEPDGIDEDWPPEDDCCCCWGQPPMRNAQTAPTAVTCTATTGRDLRER